MATVYLANDLKHGRKVALKILRPELAAVIGAERFLQEITVTAGLQHPHILQLYDSGSVDGVLYYVMPYVEGESLRDKLDREKQLSVEEAIDIARGVASALTYAHKHGVIHRDIKPANILLVDDQPVVADFGIALAVTAAGGTRLTETGLSLGTPHYMSPEQAMGDREVDARSDVYALGCVVYEMLAGEPPYTGPTAQAILAKLLTEKPRRLSLYRDTVPPHVEATVHRALAKLPADRFPTPVAFADNLARSTVGVSIDGGATAPTRAQPRQGRPAVSGWLGWLAAATLALVAAWGWLARPPAAPV
jgi:serine/threonine-protein kinase